MSKTQGNRNITFITKNKFVYDQLKESIIKGDLKPDERLVISRLAKHFGISEIPIREAISKLSSEGLVTHIPHVGARITPINYPELKENFIIRTELEGLATLHAVEHLTDRDFQRLQKNIDWMRQVIDKKEFSKVGAINKEFHRIIYQACPYPKLCKMIFDLWDNIDRVQSVFALVPRRAESSLREHIEILRALQQGDGHLAQSSIKKQKQLAWKDLESYFDHKAALADRSAPRHRQS